MIRIKIKQGVRLRGVSPQLVFGVVVAAAIWEELGAEEYVWTSATDGVHMKGSYHNSGDGFDSRTWTLPGVVVPINVAEPPAIVAEAHRLLTRRLRDQFQFVIEKTHIHGEFVA